MGRCAPSKRSSKQRRSSGGDAVNGAVARYRRPVGCAILSKSRRRDEFEIDFKGHGEFYVEEFGCDLNDLKMGCHRLFMSTDASMASESVGAHAPEYQSHYRHRYSQCEGLEMIGGKRGTAASTVRSLAVARDRVRDPVECTDKNNDLVMHRDKDIDMFHLDWNFCHVRMLPRHILMGGDIWCVLCLEVSEEPTVADEPGCRGGARPTEYDGGMASGEYGLGRPGKKKKKGGATVGFGGEPMDPASNRRFKRRLALRGRMTVAFNEAEAESTGRRTHAEDRTSCSKIGAQRKKKATAGVDGSARRRERRHGGAGRMDITAPRRASRSATMARERATRRNAVVPKQCQRGEPRAGGAWQPAGNDK
ncbi:hypothetical protein Scep_007487 [Stephania cephalantha]|uniref:Uncharacterized protein n=1 Tax=Stephania cephalantha TaxID=152367 RepID=A0AAP0KBA0_9MAGN